MKKKKLTRFNYSRKHAQNINQIVDYQQKFNAHYKETNDLKRHTNLLQKYK
jgi:hypothetical protein